MKHPLKIAQAATVDFLVPRAKWLIWLCALASLCAPVSRSFPVEGMAKAQWALELIAHGQWVYLTLGAISVAVLLAIKRAWWSIGPALLIGMSFAVQPATLERAAGPAGTQPTFTVGTANLNFDSTDFGPLSHWLLSEDAPDVVFLQEFTSRAQSAVKNPELMARYPHRLEAPQDDQFGLAVLSRHPLSDAQKVEPQDERATLRLRALLTWNGRPVHLTALHPMPPLDADYAQVRDQALSQEARHLAQAGGLALMAGDFNNTPWTRGMFEIDSRMQRASGFSASWPNAFGWLSLLPLDHVLASRGWQLLSANAGPDLGSDHRPVVVRLIAP